MSRNGSREDVELVDVLENGDTILVATKIDGISVALQVRRDATSEQLEAAAVDALQEARHRLGLSAPNPEPDLGIATGEPIPDGGVSYCSACHRSIAREDLVEGDGENYHRQCAPDDVVAHDTLDRFPEGSR